MVNYSLHKMQQEIAASVELEKAVIQLIDNRVLENRIKDHVQIEVEDIVAIKKAHMQLTKGESYVVLVYSGEFSSISKEARELSAGDEYVKETIAKALLVNSLGQKLVVNFYLSVNRPKIKTKMFLDKKKALEWLYLQLKDADS